jgi:hypothetical protein
VLILLVIVAFRIAEIIISKSIITFGLDSMFHLKTNWAGEYGVVEGCAVCSAYAQD